MRKYRIMLPMTVAQLKQTVATQFGTPCDITVGVIETDDGWQIHSIKLELFNSTTTPVLEGYLSSGSAIVTARQKPKTYKALESLYTEVRRLGGRNAVITLSLAPHLSEVGQ